MMNDSSANNSLPTVQCAIYTRSATVKQGSDTRANQERICRAAAKQLPGCTVLDHHVYSEQASGLGKRLTPVEVHLHIDTPILVEPTSDSLLQIISRGLGRLIAKRGGFQALRKALEQKPRKRYYLPRQMWRQLKGRP